jgi:poly-beta-1,6-N-acetyl-D-glucosamine synthase
MRNYVIITPVRDEAEYIGATVRSMVKQTILPTRWIIVNDGSTDETGRIVEEAAQKHSWISALHFPDRGFRQPGTGVMEAFYYGYQSLSTNDWDFIVKLDGDVSVEPDYFQKCLEKFHADPKLGIGGGTMCTERNGVLKEEVTPRFHVRGPTKIYRHACWDAIGGLIKAPGWDTVDEVKANMIGWRTQTFSDITAIHLRPTGAEQGSWRDAVKNGRADYISGYHPLFMAAKCLKRMLEKPYIAVGLGHFCGFLSGYMKGTPKVNDPALIRYARRQQMRRLLFLDSIWK